MIGSPDAASLPWPVLMLTNPQFWHMVIIPGAAGLMSFGLARFLSRRTAIIAAAITVIPWSAYWFATSVPALSSGGMVRAVTFIACLTLIPATVASVTGICVGASRRPASNTLAVLLVIGIAIVATAASAAVAFSLIDLVNAQG